MTGLDFFQEIDVGGPAPIETDFVHIRREQVDLLCAAGLDLLSLDGKSAAAVELILRRSLGHIESLPRLFPTRTYGEVMELLGTLILECEVAPRTEVRVVG
ncbi:hypothetical protein JNUCC0626_20110 [Lentzea sp. JNUCC 0626]|uniref:hypothetical protein n=1 Tax=Lentzea sp. JNUCC 0626 TaxID=3367513 RepID=UPI003749B7D8